MARVAVVGGGLGGMGAALRLRAQGHDVALFERRGELGGKLAVRRRAGFAFETGPSLLTLPQVLADLTAVAGRQLSDLVRLVEVDPACRYHFADGSVLDASGDVAVMRARIDELAAGEGRGWQAFHDRGRRCWEASARTFFDGSAGSTGRSSPLFPASASAASARVGASLADLLAVDPHLTLADRARRSFSDPRLRQYVGRYATYAGSSPYRAPAALMCIPYLEQAYGAWYVDGGLIRLRDALTALLADTGVRVQTGTAVTRILADGPRVRGVELDGGEHASADIVVANADAAHLYTDLLPDARARRRIDRLGPSSSALLLLAGVRGRTPELAHHNVLFSGDYRREFADIFARGVPPEEPTLYVGCSAVTDPSQAPEGDENWIVLANVPATDPRSWPRPPEAYRELVLDRLAGHGFDLRGRVAVSELVTPADFARRHAAWRGALYGTSSNSRLAPLLRPGNRGPLRGLYLVGGSCHPGGGVPLVTMGAAIVADLIARDFPG